MKRRRDWRQRLSAYLRKAGGKRFRPGELDCFLFAVGAVKAMTDEEIAPELRGYRTIDEGQAMAQAYGYADHVDVFAQALEEIDPRQARPGDIAVVPGDGGLAMGVVQGAQIYVMGLHGFGLVPRSNAERAFRL